MTFLVVPPKDGLAQYLNHRSWNCFENNYEHQCLCWKWTMECDAHEGRVSSSICNYPINHLPKGMVGFFQHPCCHQVWFGKYSPKNQILFYCVNWNVNKTYLVDRPPKTNVTNLATNSSKIATCFSWPVIVVMFKKWFLLSIMTSLNITTQDEPILTITQSKQVVEKQGVSPKLITKEQFLK